MAGAGAIVLISPLSFLLSDSLTYLPTYALFVSFALFVLAN